MANNTKRIARLRSHLVEYSKTLSNLLDALTTLQTAGLTAFKPATLTKAINQLESVLADIDTGDLTEAKLARWYVRLDNGTFIERFTVDGFIEELGGPLLANLRRGEKTWERMHATWAYAFGDEAFETASASTEEEPTE